MLIRLFFIMLLVSGCNKAVENFVKGGPNSQDPPAVVPSEDELVGRKLSPGSVRAAGAGVSMSAHLTPTKQIMKSSSVNAEMSLHQVH